MNPHTVKIESIQQLTHDVLQIVCEKPANFHYLPGQATKISIDKAGWQDKKRPFTFTSLPKSEFLEFTIKTYPAHMGVTNELLLLKAGGRLILHGVFGAITYKSEGVFIAGGAGVTPFICILRDLQSRNEIGKNKLIFANKTKSDIIHEAEFKKMLGENLIHILSDEKVEGYAHGQITEEFLKTQLVPLPQQVYLCGPPPMMDAIEKQLLHLNLDQSQIIKEVF